MVTERIMTIIYRIKMIRDSFLARRILSVESYSTVTQPKAVFQKLLI